MLDVRDQALEYRLDIDPAETVRATRVVRRGLGRPWLTWAAGAMLLLNVGLNLAGGARLRDLWLFGATALALLALSLAVPLIQTWHFRRLYASTPSLRGPQVYRLSGEGVTITGGPATTSLGWDAFVKAMETPEFFLLFYNKRCAYYLPKRVIGGPAEQSALRALLDACLGSRARPVAR